MNIDSNKCAVDPYKIYSAQIFPSLYMTNGATANDGQPVLINESGQSATETKPTCCTHIAWLVFLIVFLAILLVSGVITTTLVFTMQKNKSNNQSIPMTNNNITQVPRIQTIPTTTKNTPFNINKFNDWSNITCSYGYVWNGIDCDECGVHAKLPNVKIIGGIPAVPNSWPATVLVVFTYKFDFGKVSPEYSFMCTGSLISRYTVMTAAHCVLQIIEYQSGNNTVYIPVVPNKYFPTLESMFTLYLGAYNITFLSTNRSPPAPIITAKLSSVIKNSAYDSVTHLNDIALLILTEPVVLNTHINLACLPYEQSATYPSVHQNSWVAGWGTLSEYGPRPNVLYNVQLTVFNSTECFKYSATNWDSQICAGWLSGGKDSCQGDSGSSLYVIDSNNSDKQRFVTSGIVSYGYGCARTGFPGIYTRTAYFLDWIKQNWKVS